MISVYVHQDGGTKCVERVEPEWLDPSSRVIVWVDLSEPAAEEGRILSDVFHFHALSVEDALSVLQFPKIETYPGYLYIVLHGIDVQKSGRRVATHDVDFFLGPNYLVAVHDGHSRSIARLRELCDRTPRILEAGPVALMHRIVDSMVGTYRPVMEEFEKRLTTLEEQSFQAQESLVRQVLKLKRDLASMRRILVPQRDAIGRLARREFSQISDEMAYRFRDVYDQVVRLTEETMLFQDRVTGIIDVNLATVSNRLNQVMKVLTVMSTIFLPLTVLTGMWGMNLPLPAFPGGEEAQFWWIAGIMLAIIGTMLYFFRRKGWI
ncbi:MAG TPA: magnesium/cobalt transporter CorA [Vicinamibacterales bacterium]